MTWAIDAVLAAVLVGLVWLGAKRGLMKSLAGVISVGAAFSAPHGAPTAS